MNYKLRTRSKVLHTHTMCVSVCVCVWSCVCGSCWIVCGNMMATVIDRYAFSEWSKNLLCCQQYSTADVLMAWSCSDFDNAWRWWRWWCWNYHFLDGTNVIFDFNKWLLWILKTTFRTRYRLYIQTCFHFNRYICNDDEQTKNSLSVFM